MYMYTSFLSPGDECGILEDMAVAISELESVQFQVYNIMYIRIYWHKWGDGHY